MISTITEIGYLNIIGLRGKSQKPDLILLDRLGLYTSLFTSGHKISDPMHVEEVAPFFYGEPGFDHLDGVDFLDKGRGRWEIRMNKAKLKSSVESAFRGKFSKLEHSGHLTEVTIRYEEQLFDLQTNGQDKSMIEIEWEQDYLYVRDAGILVDEFTSLHPSEISLEIGNFATTLEGVPGFGINDRALLREISVKLSGLNKFMKKSLGTREDEELTNELPIIGESDESV
jgi:hypothetical protein